MNWGLVLAGGGGKGAYQIGVWKAMRELGIDKNISAVSGTSVGALNAALFSQGDIQKAEKVWNDISEELLLKDRSIFDPESTANDDTTGDIFKNFFYNGRLADNIGLKGLIERSIDFLRISTSKVGLYVCCTEIISAADDMKKARYVHLNSKDRGAMLNYLLASAALPVVYGRQNINGRSYLDGGLLDNIPVKPLVDAGYKKLLVIHLDKYSSSIRNVIPYDIKVIEIIPQSDLGSHLDGTLDFSNAGARSRMSAGYYEALRLLKPYLKEFQGYSFDSSTIRNKAQTITDSKNASMEIRIKNAVKKIVK